MHISVPLLLMLFVLSDGDVFTSMSSIDLLFDVNTRINKLLPIYLEYERKRLEKIQEFADELERFNQQVELEGHDNFAHPIKIYSLIKMFSIDWTSIRTLIWDDSTKLLFQGLTDRDNNTLYPVEEDFVGAAIALHRLQDTYHLSAHQMSSGKVLNAHTKIRLNSNDCFNIGKAAYNREDHYHTVMWMSEALSLFEVEIKPVSRKEDILEYLSYSLHMQENHEHALYFARKLSEIDPDRRNLKSNIQVYQSLAKMETNSESELPSLKLGRFFEDVPDRDEYESLCRDEFQIASSEQSTLYCYLKTDRPFLQLAPIKVEIMHHHPLVVLFRNVITDAEIETLQELTTPRLRRATVQTGTKERLEYASFRISQSAWLEESEHPVIKTINQRIEQMTNLDQATAEDIQVANYGIGGHYESHYDMSSTGEYPFGPELGDRVATLLFYISDVEAGGRTVFVAENLSIPVSKYDAAFWYNLHRNGAPDLRTRHAACPVLLGTKWVANKWIHERGQEFRRPCGVRFDAEERYIGDIRL